VRFSQHNRLSEPGPDLYFRNGQSGEQFDVAHALACTFEQSLRVLQAGSVKKAQVQVISRRAVNKRKISVPIIKKTNLSLPAIKPVRRGDIDWEEIF
jgi:hypothetical protein